MYVDVGNYVFFWWVQSFKGNRSRGTSNHTLESYPESHPRIIPPNHTSPTTSLFGHVKGIQTCMYIYIYVHKIHMSTLSHAHMFCVECVCIYIYTYTSAKLIFIVCTDLL